MNLPNDPIMLMSVINMKLRDSEQNIDELCAELCVDKADIVRRLADAGFEYDEAGRRFR